ncbi:MAG TPA: hypothetical protein VKB67_04230 [Rhizomicrobium sp.]|nr:hypothetical protein [Rhizomicrobium sp.]
MIGEVAAKRRECYLNKIEEAEEIAASATSPETVSEMEILIEAYRTLLVQLRPYAVTDSKSHSRFDFMLGKESNDGMEGQNSSV